MNSTIMLTLVEADAQFSTGNVQVLIRVVVKECPQVEDLTLVWGRGRWRKEQWITTR